jgi:alpha-tubulin suppressor-like RCC1 family protein
VFVGGGGGLTQGFVMSDGTVRVCGLNNAGQLGQNDVSTRSTVVSVLGISSQAITLASGQYHLAIVMNDGTVRVCGRNNTGQLGQNDLSTRSTVVSVLGISSQAIGVACGRYHTAILMNDGTVRVCGLNNYGQLGQNDVITRSTVVSVLGISSQAIAVACGDSHTVILMNDGTVLGCGYNGQGGLGQNSVTDKSTVVPFLGISSQAIAIACGLNYTVILMNDGTVRGCGRTTEGQLGQNDLTNRRTVVPFLGISSQAIAVACGSRHTAILMNDRTVRICGLNNYGQLGQNDVITRSTVVSVLGISTAAVAIACGVYSTSILMSDGTVRTVGSNQYGQLGQNDVSTRSTVVTVVLGMPTNAILIAPVLNLGPVPVTSFQLDMSTDNARKLTTSTWTTGSDEALKTNIINADLDRCVEIVSNLDLKYFKWEGVPSDDVHSLGWIAQEVAQFFPKAVSTEEANGISDFKNLNSDQLIKVMWGALKKLRADLKAKQTI